MIMALGRTNMIRDAFFAPKGQKTPVGFSFQPVGESAERPTGEVGRTVFLAVFSGRAGRNAGAPRCRP
jgi:hypothetical protein